MSNPSFLLRHSTAFGAGLLIGGALVFMLLVNAPLAHIPAEQALGERLEMIPVEVICTAIRSGQPIGGDDHVAVWSDSKSYLVTGWRFDGTMPVFSWTGAGTPEHDPDCVPGGRANGPR